MSTATARTIKRIIAALPSHGWVVIGGPSVERSLDLASRIVAAFPEPHYVLHPLIGCITAASLRETDVQSQNNATGAHLVLGLGEALSVRDQRRAPGVLMKAYPNVLFIVPTQNPFLCQAASPGGLIVCPADAEPYIADERLYNRVTTGSVDDVLIALYGLDYTWSDAAQEKRQRLAELEAKLLTDKASPDERAEFNALRNQLAFHGAEEVEAGHGELIDEAIGRAQKKGTMSTRDAIERAIRMLSQSQRLVLDAEAAIRLAVAEFRDAHPSGAGFCWRLRGRTMTPEPTSQTHCCHRYHEDTCNDPAVWVNDIGQGYCEMHAEDEKEEELWLPQ